MPCEPCAPHYWDLHCMQLIHENGASQVTVGLRCVLTLRIQTAQGTRAPCQLQEALTLWQLLSSHLSFLPSSAAPAGSSSCVWINSPVSMYWVQNLKKKGLEYKGCSLSLNQTVALWAGRTACVHFRKKKKLCQGCGHKRPLEQFFSASACPSVLVHCAQEEKGNKLISTDGSNRALAGICHVMVSDFDRRLLNKCSAPVEPVRNPSSPVERQVACWYDLCLGPDTWAGGNWGPLGPAAAGGDTITAKVLEISL